MGEQNVSEQVSDADRQRFMQNLLTEVRVLERMLDEGLFETGIRRVGAEQEMFIVDSSRRASCKALEILEELNDPAFTTELGLFNLEANLSPYVLTGHCLRDLEEECEGYYRKAQEAALKKGADIALVGILPTLSERDLSLKSMVPNPRYMALNDALLALRGSDFQFTINGLDQLNIRHDNIMLEACNTSFQVHFQVEPDEFARLYNIAQTITAPLLSSVVNSPILLGRRLWMESRIAVFENAIDTRTDVEQLRGTRSRVHFGDNWVENSVAEIFKEDIARFRPILTIDTEEDPMAMLDKGIIPKLHALNLHNGTVYRWNRACYGVADNVAHLRIENRVIPSGPTIADEIANTAFFIGLMSGMMSKVNDVRDHIDFATVKGNFLASARYGLSAELKWFNDQVLPAQDLILDELLPLAESGLRSSGIAADDIEHYLGIIERRVSLRRTGSRWQLDSLAQMEGQGSKNERLRSLTSSMIKQQGTGKPVHEWELAEFCQDQDWRQSYQTVNQYMTTELFTVRPDDIVDFVASLMDWKHVRHVPVEDAEGKLVGLISHRILLRLLAQGKITPEKNLTVGSIMQTEMVVISPQTLTVEAIRMMRDNHIACLPVVEDDKLVGMITEHDLIVVASRLLEESLLSVADDCD
ncbi:MAG: CBS domain-containing protein [Xanthomonadales bacterium]|nr:CBS domain-containing protein [Xanthomonadales bacterium]